MNQLYIHNSPYCVISVEVLHHTLQRWGLRDLETLRDAGLPDDVGEALRYDLFVLAVVLSERPYDLLGISMPSVYVTLAG